MKFPFWAFRTISCEEKFTAEMAADAMVEAVIDDAVGFSGKSDEQEDDSTVVTVKVQ